MSGDQELQVLQNTQNVDALITAIEQLLQNESQMMKREVAEKLHNRYIGAYFRAPPTKQGTVKKQAKRRIKRKRFSILNIRQRAQISTVRFASSGASLAGGMLGVATVLGFWNAIPVAIIFAIIGTSVYFISFVGFFAPHIIALFQRCGCCLGFGTVGEDIEEDEPQERDPEPQ